MSRTSADRPKGVNGTTFPGYVYKTNPNGNYGSYTTTASQIPEDPVQYDCQKNFVDRDHGRRADQGRLRHSQLRDQHGVRASRTSRA